MIEITIGNNTATPFPALDIFVKVAAHIAKNGVLEVIGKPATSIKELYHSLPLVHENNQIQGSVIYVDNYGNVISNITKEMFKKVGKSRAFTISARGLTLTQIHDTYSGGNTNAARPLQLGDHIAIFNSASHLELAIYKGNPDTSGSASSLFGLYYGDRISVQFE